MSQKRLFSLHQTMLKDVNPILLSFIAARSIQSYYCSITH